MAKVKVVGSIHSSADSEDGDNAFPDTKLNRVSAELISNVLAYNSKQVMKIIGTEGLLKAMARHKSPSFAASKGGKALHKCSDALPALILANVLEIVSL